MAAKPHDAAQGPHNKHCQQGLTGLALQRGSRGAARQEEGRGAGGLALAAADAPEPERMCVSHHHQAASARRPAGWWCEAAWPCIAAVEPSTDRYPAPPPPWPRALWGGMDSPRRGRPCPGSAFRPGTPEPWTLRRRAGTAHRTCWALPHRAARHPGAGWVVATTRGCRQPGGRARQGVGEGGSRRRGGGGHGRQGHVHGRSWAELAVWRCGMCGCSPQRCMGGRAGGLRMQRACVMDHHPCVPNRLHACICQAGIHPGNQRAGHVAAAHACTAPVRAHTRVHARKSSYLAHGGCCAPSQPYICTGPHARHA